MTTLPAITEAMTPTQEELDSEGRAWGFKDWDTFIIAYDAECERLGTTYDK